MTLPMPPMDAQLTHITAAAAAIAIEFAQEDDDVAEDFMVADIMLLLPRLRYYGIVFLTDTFFSV